jgi:hypothetical protein
MLPNKTSGRFPEGLQPGPVAGGFARVAALTHRRPLPTTASTKCEEGRWRTKVCPAVAGQTFKLQSL